MEIEHGLTNTYVLVGNINHHDEEEEQTAAIDHAPYDPHVCVFVPGSICSAT